MPVQSSRVVLLLALVLGSACRTESSTAPESAGPEPTEPVAAEAGESVVPAATTLVKPETLPAVPPVGPAPTAALPRGTPTGEGHIAELVAIDDQRAIVQFIVPGENWQAKWWLASMNRDGSIAWVQAMSGQLDSSDTGVGIVRLGDAVSVMTSALRGNDPVLTLHAFALADGTRRAKIELGKGYSQGTTSDGELRFDVRNHFTMGRGKNVVELIASDDRRVRWRAALDELQAAGPDPMVIGDAIVVRTITQDSNHSNWNVFERKTGTLRGRISARVQGCSDGERWFVLDEGALLSIDPKTLRPRRVTGDVRLPGLPGTWILEDCSVAAGHPVVLVGRGFRKALVAFDGETFEPRGQVPLGVSSSVNMGKTGYDPMPARLHEKALVEVFSRRGMRELMVIDVIAGRVIQHWSAVGEYSMGYDRAWWAGGSVVSTRHTVAVADVRTGQLAGQAMITEDTSFHQQRVAGSTLWLLDHEPQRLGRRAPRLVDLSQTPSDDVRGAVLADLNPRPSAPRGGRAPCPDPSAPLVGDGTGTDGRIVPVRPTRLPSWDLDIVHESARILACAPGSAPSRLLAWYIIEDNRPLRNDNALVMVEDTTVEPPRFTLMRLVRHATNREWGLSGSLHSREQSKRTFDHRPTRAEVDDFLNDNGWLFGDGWGKILAGNVIDADWRAATHENPWRSYPTGIEQTD